MQLRSFNPFGRWRCNIRRLHSNKLKRHLANPIIRHFHVTWKCLTINPPTFSPYVKMSDDRLSWIVRHSIMLKVTWRRFDQSAKQLVVGWTTMQYVVYVSFMDPSHYSNYQFKLLSSQVASTTAKVPVACSIKVGVEIAIPECLFVHKWSRISQLHLWHYYKTAATIIYWSFY